MYYPTALLCSFVAVAAAVVPTNGTRCLPFPSSMELLSSRFEQSAPPLVQSAFGTNFIQHKWNSNMSHITTGHIYNSPEQGKVRVDQAHEGTLASSLFNYGNVSENGLVDNTMVSFTEDFNKPGVFHGYVHQNFPLWTTDVLVQNKAVFGGLVERDFVSGKVASWNIMYQGTIPVTVFVNSCNVIVGYDYFSLELRTRVVTMYFNTQIGPVTPDAFSAFSA
ncbi:hypothetical protein BDV29DRAFT_50558 [Aspergillus leporis]|uniref:Uncharacterized protein n=1 Tax=Aspergillus leporis TaxID=41062 RepID=A0A5N5WQM9_9EURO|nr:hypothetical protein BDV29DRAFT_50558 [Aspergillus leporis]